MSVYIPDIRSEKPEARSGHICVYFRGNIFLWGGFTDGEDGVHFNKYISSECLWMYNIDTCTWKHVLCNGDIPDGLGGACASRVGQTMYLFAGHRKASGHSNTLYSLDLVTYKWTDHSGSVKGQPPLPRDKFGLWAFDNRIIYFGGYGPSPDSRYHGPFHEHMRGSTAWNGQVAVLSINPEELLEWKYPVVKGHPPQPRAAHGMTRIGSKGYLFGGRHSVCRDNDLHCLDLENFTWSGRVQVNGPEPCGRSWHVFVTCGSKHILLHGGFGATDNELDDAWLLDVHSFTWIQIDAFNQMRSPRTRLWHAACQTENEGEIVIFGGCSGSLFESPAYHTNDLVFFYFTPRNLQRLCEEAVVQSRGNQVLHLHTLPKQILRNLQGRFSN